MTPVQSTDFYGKGLLAQKSNAKALLAAYDRIVAGIEKAVTEIDLSDLAQPITVEELKEIWSCYSNDYPQHFWVENGYEYSYTSTSVVQCLAPTYTIDPSQLKTAKAKWDTAVTEILKDISGLASDYDREKAIHDRLAAKVTYEESENAHTAYGALVEGKAVCEGYAKAFQYLCYQAGLPCMMVTGSSLNPSTGNPESHAWNMVQIDGAYYHVDVTWDDQASNTYYAYFNVTDRQIKEDHAIATDEATLSVLPACNATTANYFVKNNEMLGSSYTVQQIGTLLKEGNGTARLFVSDINAFWKWFGENISEICKASGIYGHCSSSCLGHEVVVRFA